MKRLVKSAIRILRTKRYLICGYAKAHERFDIERFEVDLQDLYKYIEILQDLPRGGEIELHVYNRLVNARRDAAEIADYLWFLFKERMSSPLKWQLLIFSAITLTLQALARLYPTVNELEYSLDRDAEVVKVHGSDVETEHLCRDIVATLEEEDLPCGI